VHRRPARPHQGQARPRNEMLSKSLPRLSSLKARRPDRHRSCPLEGIWAHPPEDGKSLRGKQVQRDIDGWLFLSPDLRGVVLPADDLSMIHGRRATNVSWILDLDSEHAINRHNLDRREFVGVVRSIPGRLVTESLSQFLDPTALVAHDRQRSRPSENRRVQSSSLSVASTGAEPGLAASPRSWPRASRSSSRSRRPTEIEGHPVASRSSGRSNEARARLGPEERRLAGQPFASVDHVAEPRGVRGRDRE
jgi:hypothetical protein